MYRKKMQEQDQFLLRVGNLPVVTSALAQVASLYGKTKDRNVLFRSTLGMAESGLKMVAYATVSTPGVNKVQAHAAGQLNNFACDQLDKWEKTYPIITQPTDKVIAETRQLYEKSAIKGTVDSLLSVANASLSTCVGIKNAGTQQVDNVKQAGFNSLKSAKDYGNRKMAAVLSSPYAQVATGIVDSSVGRTLNTAEQYVSYYLPPEPSAVEGESTDEKEDKKDDASSRARLTLLTEKVRQRMYARVLKHLRYTQQLGEGAVRKLNFSVYLAYKPVLEMMQHVTEKSNIDQLNARLLGGYGTVREQVAGGYTVAKDSVTSGYCVVKNRVSAGYMTAKSRTVDGYTFVKVKMSDGYNIAMDTVVDGYNFSVSSVMNGYTAGKDELMHIFEEINKSEDEVVTNEASSNQTLESRLIATARHMTLKLKSGLATISAFHIWIPDRLKTSPYLSNIRASSFTVENLKAVPPFMVQLTRAQLQFMQTIFESVVEYTVDSSALNWLVEKWQRKVKKEANGLKEEENVSHS